MKRIIAMLLALGIIFGFAACSPPEGQTQGDGGFVLQAITKNKRRKMKNE